VSSLHLHEAKEKTTKKQTTAKQALQFNDMNQTSVFQTKAVNDLTRPYIKNPKLSTGDDKKHRTALLPILVD